MAGHRIRGTDQPNIVRRSDQWAPVNFTDTPGTCVDGIGRETCVAASVRVMGQPVAVEEKRSVVAATVRFETNRSLTGMGHERFAGEVDTKGTRPAAVVARRLFETGQVSGVHVFGNIVTCTLAPGATAQGLTEIVRDLYQYWKPGMAPPSAEELMAQVEAPAAATESASSDAGSGPVVDSRVPAHLLERSAAARARWAEKSS